MILNSYNNILVLAPHTDNGELGYWEETISKLIELGKKIRTYIAFSTASAVRTRRFCKRYFEDRSQESDCPIGNIT